MRPGMTGLAQITVRNSVVWDKRIVIDNIYIDEFNILLDTKILLLTVARIIKPQSIYYSTPVAREVKAKDLNI